MDPNWRNSSAESETGKDSGRNRGEVTAGMVTGVGAMMHGCTQAAPIPESGKPHPEKEGFFDSAGPDAESFAFGAANMLWPAAFGARFHACLREHRVVSNITAQRDIRVRIPCTSRGAMRPARPRRNRQKSIANSDLQELPSGARSLRRPPIFSVDPAF